MASENRQAKRLSLTNCCEKGFLSKGPLDRFDADDLAFFYKTALARKVCKHVSACVTVRKIAQESSDTHLV